MQNSVLFSKLPCFKNSPFKVHLEFPRKIPCFFQKFPVQKKVDFTNSVFFSKNSVFYKIPRFSDFKSLKNTHEKHVFLYKNIYLQIKSIYLQIKNIYKRQGFSLRIIFTVFLIFFFLVRQISKKLCVNICF